MIKSFHQYILFLLLAAGSVQGIFAQEGEYHTHRSKDKIILEGKVYYIHIVREKETLYGISKAYNVTEKVIASENPEIFGGLQAGMYLKIPAEPVVDESLEIRETDDFFYHVVKEGETLYFLSKKYGVDVIAIENANPEVTVSNLQLNQVIKIPKRNAPAEEIDFPSDSYVYHYVNKGETLYSLSVKYDVSIEEIKEINPELRWGDLKSDEYIKIPRRADRVMAEENLDSLRMVLDSLKGTVISPDSSYHITEETFRDTAGIPFWSKVRWRQHRPEPLRRPIQIAMLLPLYLQWDEVVDTLELEGEEAELALEEEEEDDIVNPRIIGYLEFYEGALMAIDSLRRSGISISLHTFDTERDRQRTREILQKTELREMDMIIGPVGFWNLEIVSEFARRHEIPLLSPFSSDENIVKYNPWIIQTTPTYEVEFRAWADYLSDFYDKTIILVHNGDPNEYHKVQFLKNELFRNISEKADLEDLVFKEVVLNDTVEVDMAHVLNREQENLVIVPSDNEAYASNVISPLYYQLSEYKIQVSGMPQWNRFRNIDLIYFHNLNISYYTSFYMDFDKPELEKFIEDFYSVYRTQPYRIYPRGYNLSVYGYDLLLTFGKALSEYGENLIYYGEEIENDPILGSYKFSRINDFGGHVNSWFSVVKFSPDLSIEQHELESRPGQEYRFRRSRLYRPYGRNDD